MVEAGTFTCALSLFAPAGNDNRDEHGVPAVRNEVFDYGHP